MKWKFKRPGLPNLSVCVMAAGVIAASIAIPAVASSDGGSKTKPDAMTNVAKSHRVVTSASKAKSAYPICLKRHHGHKLCADSISSVATVSTPGHGCYKHGDGDKLCAVDVGCATLPAQAIKAIPATKAAKAVRLRAKPMKTTPPLPAKPKDG